MGLRGALWFAVAVSGCATTPLPNLGGTAADLIIREADENALGAQAHADLAAHGLRFIEDTGANSYLEALFARLTPAAHADRPLDYTLHLVDAPDEVRAFATAGGHVYVSSGLLLAAQNDAEVAAALAHELGHLVARHPLEHFLHGYGWGHSAQMSWRARPERLQTAAEWLAREAPFDAHRPSEERAADTWAARYLWRAGYDARALGTFFSRLAEGDTEEPWLRSHPVDGRRRDHLERTVKRGHYDRGGFGATGHLEAAQHDVRRPSARR